MWLLASEPWMWNGPAMRKLFLLSKPLATIWLSSWSIQWRSPLSPLRYRRHCLKLWSKNRVEPFVVNSQWWRIWLKQCPIISTTITFIEAWARRPRHPRRVPVQACLQRPASTCRAACWATRWIAAKVVTGFTPLAVRRATGWGGTSPSTAMSNTGQKTNPAVKVRQVPLPSVCLLKILRLDRFIFLRHSLHT